MIRKRWMKIGKNKQEKKATFKRKTLAWTFVIGYGLYQRIQKEQLEKKIE